jgi:hypothetical protein
MLKLQKVRRRLMKTHALHLYRHLFAAAPSAVTLACFAIFAGQAISVRVASGLDLAQLQEVEEPIAGGENLACAPPVVISLRKGPTGVINLQDDSVFAQFFANDTILSASDAPHCVAWLRSTRKIPLSAGTLIVTGDMVGQPDGPAAPIRVGFDPEYFAHLAYLDRPPFLFRQGTAQVLKVKTTGTATFPAFPPTRLRSAGFPLLTILTPVLDDAGNLTISSTKGLRITWRIPLAAGTARVGVSLLFLFAPGRVGEVRCGAPVSAGKMVLPASLLTAVKQRLSPNAPIGGAEFYISLGDQRIRNVNGASYVIEVRPTVVDDLYTYGTTFGGLLGAVLD